MGDSPSAEFKFINQTQRPLVINEGADLTQDGYLVNYSALFILVAELTGDGPVADAIVSYSQSDDPDYPEYSDQMSPYSSKTWRPLPFMREQIEADSTLTSMRWVKTRFATIQPAPPQIPPHPYCTTPTLSLESPPLQTGRLWHVPV
jgi:hypothetical protein